MSASFGRYFIGALGSRKKIVVFYDAIALKLQKGLEPGREKFGEVIVKTLTFLEVHQVNGEIGQVEELDLQERLPRASSLGKEWLLYGGWEEGRTPGKRERVLDYGQRTLQKHRTSVSKTLKKETV